MEARGESVTLTVRRSDDTEIKLSMSSESTLAELKCAAQCDNLSTLWFGDEPLPDDDQESSLEELGIDDGAKLALHRAPGVEIKLDSGEKVFVGHTETVAELAARLFETYHVQGGRLFLQEVAAENEFECRRRLLATCDELGASQRESLQQTCADAGITKGDTSDERHLLCLQTPRILAVSGCEDGYPRANGVYHLNVEDFEGRLVWEVSVSL